MAAIPAIKNEKKDCCGKAEPQSMAYYSLHAFSCIHVLESFFIAYLGCKKKFTAKVSNEPK